MNFWLSRLQCDLDAQEDIEPLAKVYKGKEKKRITNVKRTHTM